MTTTQEPLNGHRVSPPPCSTENPAEANRADLPTNKANNNQGPFPAGAYHVPPERYAPKADFRPQEFHSGELDTTPLPERCQFMFSDGRQCSMARSDIHPSLCCFHSEREDQLFGHPTPGGHVVGRAFDLPELYSASRDLTTAAGVNRALGQVFRLLAQRRISRQEAATFGHLAQLLLRSISAARASRESGDVTSIAVPSSGESHAHQELSPVNRVHRERGIPPDLSRPGRLCEESLSDRRTSRCDGQSAASPVKNQHTNGAIDHQPISTAVNPSTLSEVSAASSAPEERAAAQNSLQTQRSAVTLGNSPKINTYENTGLKPVQNQHLRKGGEGASNGPKLRFSSEPTLHFS